jgi:hypothetical protein
MTAPEPAEPTDPTDPTDPVKPTQPSGSPEPTQPSQPAESDPDEEQRQFNLREQNAAWKAVAYLITGPLIYGGLGALLDHWLGTSWLVGVGIVGGMALSLYLIWFRYGTH